jgi:glycosyltransferase involved in cell wall biosynthesis
VLASEQEGSPNIIKEALACNLPIVAVDVGDVAERLAGTAPSRIVARSPAAMGDALVEILRIGGRSNGREKIAQLSEEYIPEQLRSIYMEIAERPATARAGVETATGEAEVAVL